jgi:large subunit ribosomal protein L30
MTETDNAMAKLKITQVRSTIGRLENQKRTIAALGLGRPNNVVVQNDTPQIRGMIRKVSHLVKVEEVEN